MAGAKRDPASTQCQGKVPEGRRCMKGAGANGYCWQHQDQAAQARAGKCRATCGNGQLCESSATQNGYCRISAHQRQAQQQLSGGPAGPANRTAGKVQPTLPCPKATQPGKGAGTPQSQPAAARKPPTPPEAQAPRQPPAAKAPQPALPTKAKPSPGPKPPLPAAKAHPCTPKTPVPAAAALFRQGVPGEDLCAERKFVMKTIRVSGCNGSATDRTRSWLQKWSDCTGRDHHTEQCIAAGCQASATLGAHLWREDSASVLHCYIAPVCSTHNNRNYDYPKWFPTKRNIALMKIRAHKDLVCVNKQGVPERRIRQEA